MEPPYLVNAAMFLLLFLFFNLLSEQLFSFNSDSDSLYTITVMHIQEASVLKYICSTRD